MANLIFNPSLVPNLYVGYCDGEAAPLYYVTKQPGPSDPLKLIETWKTYPGYYVFVGKPVADLVTFTKAVISFAKDIDNARFLWFEDPHARPLTGSILRVFQPDDKTGESTFTFRTISLRFDSAIPIFIDEEQAKFTVDPKGTPQRIYMRAQNQGSPYDIEPPVSIHLCGEQAGTLRYGIKLDRPKLFAFGADIRYFSPDQQTPDFIVARRYPVIDLKEPDPDGNPVIRFAVQLDPAAPRNYERTFFAFPIGEAENSYKSYYRTTTGQSLFMTPQGGPQFARLALAPFPEGVPESRSQKGYYLAPVGKFALVSDPNGGRVGKQRRARKAVSEVDEPQLLMAGLSTTEFISARLGDILNYIPDQPAFAPKFPLVRSEEETVLLVAETPQQQSEVRTSWLSVENSGRLNDFGYYAQPDSTVYYGQGVENPNIFLVPDAIQVSPPGKDLDQDHAFPSAPYSGVAALINEDEPLPNPPLKDLESFERQILNPTRRKKVPENPSGPIFNNRTSAKAGQLRLAASMFRPMTADGAPTSFTPQGFLAKLNSTTLSPGDDVGVHTWKELVLARGPASDQVLSFSGTSTPPTVNPVLANALMHNEMFLVISRSTNVGTFASKVTIGGFTLDLALAGKEDKTLKTVLIFKFRSGKSLREMVEDLNYWTEPETFTDNSGKAIQEYIVKYLDAAKKDPQLQSFNDLVEQPSWNGILALNCDIGGQGLPTEIQGLSGGLSAPLKGHHLGIEINQVRLSPAEITKSSLFGVIIYPPVIPDEQGDMEGEVKAIALAEEPADYDYQVDSLLVVFANSAIVDFNCKVLLTLNKLFGRPVELLNRATAENSILITGSYQEHNGKNTFVFESSQDNVFKMVNRDIFLRVLSEVGISRADFTTISSVATDEGNSVTSRFALDGRLSFDQINLPGQKPFDLFGYGGSGKELPFSGLNLVVNFILKKDGTTKDRKLNLSPATINFNQGAKVPPRTGSLVHSFPLTLGAFKYDEKGLDASKMGGQQVQIPELSAVSNGENSGAEQVTREYVTTAPLYALEFTLPLGSLGSLSSVHISLDARLIVGWGPSQTIPDDDAVAVAINLPQVTPGFKGFGLQGVLQTTFGSCNLARFKELYVIMFNNVALNALVFRLPPGYVIDFLLFANPGSTESRLSNLAWFLAVQKEEPSTLALTGKEFA